MLKVGKFVRSRSTLLLLFLSFLVLIAWSHQASTTRPVAAAPSQSTKPQPPEPQSPTIVGGEEAEPGAWPWQVALIFAGGDPYLDQFCGGTLIDEEWVMTAAHCGEGFIPPQIEVIAGIHNLAEPDPSHQRLSVERIIIHPNYNAAAYDFDIALLELATPAVLGQPDDGLPVAVISPVAADAGSLEGVMSTVTGWGNLLGQPDPGGSDFPETLYQVEVPITSDSDCHMAYGSDVTDNMLCAGYMEGGKDSCQGDSGGPLVIFDEPSQRWLEAGIVSWGFGCAAPNYPGVYTRVSRFTQWIYETSGISRLRLAATPEIVDQCAGNPASYLVSVAPPADLNEIISLSATEIPPGATASFDPPSLDGPGQSNLEVLTTDIPAGAYTMQVVATAPSTTESIAIGLSIYSEPSDAPQPQTPDHGSTGVAVRPTFAWSATAQTSAYRLEIATDSDFQNIVQSVETAAPSHTLSEALAADTLYHWRVQSLNPCGAGGVSAVQSFITVNVTCHTADLAIPDHQSAGVRDTIHMTKRVSIADLDVSIQATHSFVGDLTFTLEHVDSGTQITLLNRPGVPATLYGCSGANVDARFDDEAKEAAETACEVDPALAGQLRPPDSLAEFNSDNLVGDWVLTVSDNAPNDTGTLVEWCLLVQTGQESICDNVSEIPAAECQALVSLYEGTNGQSWNDQKDWLVTTTPCSWFGVSCTGTHVTKLDLADNDLNGPLPKTIGNLSQLADLVISGNALRGPLPLSLTALELQTFWYDDTNLCEPENFAFQSWLEGIPDLHALNHPCRSVYLPLTQ